jgi:hypothetical protein
MSLKVITMNKMTIIISIILASIISTTASAVTQVYDSKRDVFHIGGYVSYHAQEVLKEKPATRFDKKIYEINAKKEESKVFVKTKDDIVFFELSNAGHMAVSTTKYVPNTSKPHRDYLSIYSRTGELIKTIEDVPVITREKYFTWSPDGTKIAFVKGERIPDSKSGPFKPMGVWLYDIEKDELKKISDDGWDVRWARHDNKIHILKYTMGPTYVYDTKTGRLAENKDGKGIILSPDGKYYIGTTMEPGDMEDKEVYHVYDGHTNEKIYTFDPYYLYWGYSRFISDKYLLIRSINWSYKVFDVFSKTDYRNPSKIRLLGWNKDMTKVVVYEGGNQVHIEELLTGKRLKSIDIPK